MSTHLWSLLAEMKNHFGRKSEIVLFVVAKFGTDRWPGVAIAE
jgi:hypothetical protein